MKNVFDTKQAARDAVWDRLEREHAARFPFPPHGRIPNFADARAAAERLLEHPLWKRVRRVKINPDAPQRPVRELALRKGITVYVPTPRLRGGFKEFDPARIPAEKYAAAASLSKGQEWAKDVALEDMPPMDLVVTGCVAVTADGNRCGKGHGYADLEYAILLELGHSPVPVVTTVHPLQLVDGFPGDDHDLTVTVIVTPGQTLEVQGPPRVPQGVDWDRLDAEALREMPVLRALRAFCQA